MTAKNQIAIPRIALYVIALIVWWAVSYGAVTYLKYRDKISFTASIDTLLQGQNAISDYDKTQVTGTLYPVRVEPEVPEDLLPSGSTFKNLKVVRAGSDLIAAEPERPIEPEPGSNNDGLHQWAMDQYEQKMAEWEKMKGLVEFYDCRTGEFTVFQLRKRMSGYDVIEYSSKNMAFKIPDKKWIPGTDYGYGYSSPGMYISTRRTSVQDAYNSTMDFLMLDDKKKETYVPGSINAINDIRFFTSRYHSLSKESPTAHERGQLPFAAWTDEGKPYIENAHWVVWYGIEGKHYEIAENKSAFYYSWIIYSCIGTIIPLIIVGFLRFRRKYSFRVK